MMLENFIISAVIFALILFYFWVRITILKAKNEDLKLRLHFAEEIGEVMKKLKKNSDDKSYSFKSFFDSVLNLSEDPQLIKNFMPLFILWKQTEYQVKETTNDSSNDSKGVLSWLEKNCDDEEKERLQDIIALIVLSFLHASTYNFWRGRFFRNFLFPDVVNAKKPAEAAAKRRDFVDREDTRSVFGKIFPNNWQTA